MSNWRHTLGLILFLGLLYPWVTQNAWARRPSLGISVGQEMFLDDPTTGGELGQSSLNLYLGYYLFPQFSLAAGFETDLDSSAIDGDDRAITTSATYLFRPFSTLDPYLRGEGIFVFDPDVFIGYRVGGGVLFDLFKVMGTDGLYLFLQTAYRALYFKENVPVSTWEFYRVGLEYTF